MARRIPYRWLVAVGGLVLAGCAANSPSGEDPYFPGFHSNHSGDGFTPIIVDRSQLGSERKRPIRPQVKHYGDEPGNSRDYMDRIRRDYGSQFNLVYHLYGPDHHRSYGQRYWLNYRRQWGQLPWYGQDPYYNSWWNDPYWSWEYRWNSWAWDPWFDHFYDPWYWEPYGGYGFGYGYNYSYYYRYPSGQYWYYQRGTVASSSDDGHKQRRPRNRRGGPENQGGQFANNPLAGSVNKASSGGGSSSSSTTKRRGRARQSNDNPGKSQVKSADSSSGNNGHKQARPRKRRK